MRGGSRARRYSRRSACVCRSWTLACTARQCVQMRVCIVRSCRAVAMPCMAATRVHVATGSATRRWYTRRVRAFSSACRLSFRRRPCSALMAAWTALWTLVCTTSWTASAASWAVQRSRGIRRVGAGGAAGAGGSAGGTGGAFLGAMSGGTRWGAGGGASGGAGGGAKNGFGLDAVVAAGAGAGRAMGGEARRGAGRGTGGIAAADGGAV